jgi:hypothetical protein
MTRVLDWNRKGNVDWLNAIDSQEEYMMMIHAN